MKEKVLLLLVFVTSCLSVHAGVAHLLPKPQQITLRSEAAFPLQSVALSCGDVTDVFTEWIQEECGGEVNPNATHKITVTLVDNLEGADFQEEAYSLRVTDKEITIKSTTSQGAIWALQTLAQLADGGTPVPAVEILDWPAFRIRGYMHDVGRSFITFEELKKEVKLLARYKMNTFHWHLTENQAWRLESKLYPALNEAKNHTRHPGLYYTIEQAKQMQQWCKRYGVTLIPEIEMPGHSECFARAFGYDMQTTAGLAKVKELLVEACETFNETPWLHIGTDETPITMGNFVPEVMTLLRANNRKVGSWSPGKYSTTYMPDMLQLWGASAPIVPGVMNIDCRNHYLNHYDMFADVAAIYTSNILGVAKQTDDRAGFIGAIWNDRNLPTQHDIIYQNQLYAALVAMAERGWIGGGCPFTQYGVVIPSPEKQEYKDFVDWERRFLYWKESHLKNEAIAYVKQTHMKWRITDAFPNRGVLDSSFGPETSLDTEYVVDGKTYKTKMATGAGIILRHFWGEVVSPAFYKAPQENTTAYAYTWVYSPMEQTVGTWIETQNYGRADTDLAAPQGKWDYKDSRIWINDQPIAPPTWLSQHTENSNEELLTNENFTARPAIEVTLKEGWNKVLLRLPIGKHRGTEVKRMKWMFAFTFVTLDQKKEVDNLIWSPDKNMIPQLDNLRMIIDEADQFRSQITIGDGIGVYPLEAVVAFDKELAAIKKNMGNLETQEQIDAAIELVSSELTKLKNATSDDFLIYSDENKQAYYRFSTPERNNWNLNFEADGTTMSGKPWVENESRMMWKLIKKTDDSFHIVNKESGCYINPDKLIGEKKNEIAATSEVPQNGWKVTASATPGLYIIFSGTVQINQGGKGPIYSYGGGTNLTDKGCKYKIDLVVTVPEEISAPLKMAISNAMNFMGSVFVGVQPGTYPQNEYAVLEEAVNHAITIWQSNPNKEQVETAVNGLNAAINNFKKAIVLPIASNTQKNYWYSLHTPNRGYLYVTSKGAKEDIMGESRASEGSMDGQLWKLVALADGSYSLVDKLHGGYISPASEVSTPLKQESGSQTEAGWKITYTGANIYFTVSTESGVQFNQQNTPYKVLNWGGGVNISDTGCQYVVTLEKEENVIPDNIDNTRVDQYIWLENGRLRSVGITEPIRIYNISGQMMDVQKPLLRGVYIAQAGGYTQRLMSK